MSGIIVVRFFFDLPKSEVYLIISFIDKSLNKSLLLQRVEKPRKPEPTAETIVGTLEEEIRLARAKAKKRKLYECNFCDFSHKNKYQKVKSSRLPVWRHHEQVECKQNFEAHDDEISKEVHERIARWKAEKEARKNKKKPCPFGCGKSWKNIYTASVKNHVLHKCSFRAGQEEHTLVFSQKTKLS